MADHTDYLAQLNQALGKFGAETVNDITDKYAYHPDYVTARLGAGSYGEAFRMRSVSNDKEPLRVVKVIPKARVSKNALQIQHLAAELAVTKFFTHNNLNKRVGLYMNTANVYIVLEYVGGATPDAKTRLLHLFASVHPRRIADFEAFYAGLERDAAAGGFATVDEYLDRSGRMRTILAECGVKREVPTSTDLFGLIVAMKRVPDGLARIINKQALLGLQHLHENAVVHRDIKTENVVVGIERHCELVYGEPAAEGQPKPVTGVRVTEKVQAKLIDFGLVKYMRQDGAKFSNALSPGAYDPTRASSQSLAANATNLGFDSDDDDAKPAAAAAQQQQQPATTNAAGFPVMVTPCGTELYCSLEVIDGIIKSGVGRTKWISDSRHLPKMDVYGVGTMLFCCANGRPPFRPPRDPYRTNISREERIKQVQRLVQAGPVFSSGVSLPAQEYVKWLMNNDPEARPTAAEALAHPYLAGVTGNTYTYEVSVDGVVTVVETAAQQQQQTSTAASITPTASANTAAPSTSNGAAGDEEEDADDDAGQHEDVLAAALRGKEDQGDSAGKNDDAAPAAEAAAA